MPKLGFQLLRRQEAWVLTWQGWLALLTCVLVVGLGGVPRLHDFLAVTAPVPAEVLVVDGWLDDEHVLEAMQEFRRQPYRRMVTVGAALPKGYYLSDYKTFAELSRQTLLKVGFPSDRVVAVVAPVVRKDRTYASALAVRAWLEKESWRVSGVPVRGINVFTEDTHARRSWQLYQKALEPRVKVGVISMPSLDYDSRRWWASSEGVKRVIFESLAWIYLQVFKVID